MNVPQPLIAIYGELAPLLRVVESRVSQALLSYAREHLLPFVARMKTIESAAEKIETGRYHSFTEIDDLVASMLVVPSLRDEEHAIEYCKQVFSISDIKRRASARKAPDSFKFDATRLYGFLVRPQGAEVTDQVTIYDIKFEIQIRTAFEHAWIVSTHPLTYKTDNIDWRRFRLASQLKASAEQLDLAVLQFEQLASGISEAPWPAIQQRREVVQLIEKLIQKKVIPTESGPQDMSRFADNLMDLLRASKSRANLGIALNVLEEGFCAFTIETFPRSASLLQISMGLLCTRGVLSGPLQEYSCHVTEELIQLYPAVGALSPVFSYNKSNPMP